MQFQPISGRTGCGRFWLGPVLLALTAGSGLPGQSHAAQRPKIDAKPTFVLKQFSTAKPLRLIAYGDMRFCDPSITKGTNPRIRRWLVEKIAEEHPQALLLTGDMPFIGENKADWEDYQSETGSWRADGFPILPTLGNHEVYHDAAKGVANYLENFPGIEGHRYYSALLGPVEVMALDMNLPVGPRSAQGQWFAAQLDHLPKSVEFLMILYHLPWVADTQSHLVASLPTKDALELRGALEARLGHIRARVLVLNGHIHNYERYEEHGVEYVVTGGGGAEPYPILFRGSHDLYRDPGFPVYHYLTIEVADHQLHAVMWKVIDPEAAELNVEAKDRFEIQSGFVSAPAAAKKR